MMTQRIADKRRQLVDQQQGRCARCGQSLDKDVHLTRIESPDDDASPTSIAATHVTCEAPPAALAPITTPANANRAHPAASCPRCGAQPSQPCVTSSGATTRPHKVRPQLDKVAA